MFKRNHLYIDNILSLKQTSLGLITLVRNESLHARCGMVTSVESVAFPIHPAIGLLRTSFSVTLTKLPAVPPPHLLSLLSRFYLCTEG
jgi:hypothetical protein